MSDPIRVLHVEDDPDSLETAATKLERTDGDLDVITATSPDGGFGVLERADVDCVVSEYQLPETDGLAFLEAVRDSHPEVPFILFTGHRSERIASRAISAGAADYLQKGREESYDLLADRIRSAVAEQSTRTYGRATDRSPTEPLERITDAFYALDTDWRFTYVNEAAEEMLGRPADELIGERFWDLYPAATETPFYDHYHGALEEGEPRTIEQYYEPTGRWFREHIYPSDSGISVVSHDITDSKQSRQQVERAQLRLSEFTDEAGPVLRETLDSLRAHCDDVREEVGDDRLEGVLEEFDRAETLTSYLLALAQCTDTAVETHWVDFPSMVHQCWEAIDPEAAVLCIDTGRSVRADRSQLRRLLESLLRNAVEHGSTSHPSSSTRDDAVEHGSTSPDSQAPDGRGSDPVRVTVGTTDDGFYVADDGPGIPAGDREKVFEPGYSTAPDGNGFGLCVVQQVVNVHGWEVRITESADGGAEFRVSGVDVR